MSHDDEDYGGYWSLLGRGGPVAGDGDAWSILPSFLRDFSSPGGYSVASLVGMDGGWPIMEFQSPLRGLINGQSHALRYLTNQLGVRRPGARDRALNVTLLNISATPWTHGCSFWHGIGGYPVVRDETAGAG